MISVAHVISTVSVGGAETALLRIASRLDPTKFRSQVISLTERGPIGTRLEAAGIPVRVLGLRRSAPDPRRIARLGRWLKADQPMIVQTWLYHGDLIGGLAARLAGVGPVVWNLRHSDLSWGANRTTTIAIASLNGLLSYRIPRAIVCGSEAARRVHAGRGYDESKMVVIPNGFDTDRFAPDPEARAAVQAELGLPADEPLVGMVARLHPQKDHDTFFRAASLLASRRRVSFILCGSGLEASNPALRAAVTDPALAGRLHLLGPRSDIPRIMAALDVATLSSLGEGFPNVVAEAMAAGTPVAATDVGDTRRIIGDTGEVVPPRDPDALAAAWDRLLSLDPAEHRERSRAARQRIERRYGLAAVVRQYERLYEQLSTEWSHG